MKNIKLLLSLFVLTILTGCTKESEEIKKVDEELEKIDEDIEKEEKYKGLKRAAEAYERELAKIETFETLKDSA